MSASVDRVYVRFTQKSYFKCLSTIYSSKTSMIIPQEDDKRVQVCNKLLYSQLKRLPSLPEGLELPT